MKKLLNLLSVLTVSGTAVPTTIAASPYQKEEKLNKLENSGFDYTVLSHLENNNYSLWDYAFSLWKIGTKKIEETKDYITENYDKIKNNILEKVDNLKNNIINSIKLNFLIKEINIEFEEFKNNLYFLTRKTNNLYKITEKGNLQLIHQGDESGRDGNIHGFSLYKNINRNIYIFTNKKLYKNNIYNIKDVISNFRFNHFYLDNENNIILKVHSYDENIDFLNLIKHNEEDIPKNIDDIKKLRKIYIPNIVDINSFNFDEYNNIYIKVRDELYLLRKYDINPIKISGKFSYDNYTGFKFYAIKDNIFIFSDKKFYHLKSGQTSIEEISIPNINDHYLDNKQENFYIATEKGIYRFNIIDQESDKFSSLISTKISIYKSNNIFIKTNNEYWYNQLLVLLKKDDENYEEYKILNNLKIGTFEKYLVLIKNLFICKYK